jgi:predicted transposase YbfD/YdcC
LGLAIDGKTLRGSRKQGAPLTHLLSAVSHHLGLTLGQTPVDDKTNEITAVHTLLEGLVLRGQVVTVDALLTVASDACSPSLPCPLPRSPDVGSRRRRRTCGYVGKWCQNNAPRNQPLIHISIRLRTH